MTECRRCAFGAADCAIAVTASAYKLTGLVAKLKEIELAIAKAKQFEGKQSVDAETAPQKARKASTSAWRSRRRSMDRAPAASKTTMLLAPLFRRRARSAKIFCLIISTRCENR